MAWEEREQVLATVLNRYAAFSRLGALHGEGGERAFRGWLMGGFLQVGLGWPWDRLVLGESFDILAVDWRDHPVVYIETKTPDQPLRPTHRAEMAGRVQRWTSLRLLYLTNGRSWERFDDPSADLTQPTVTLTVGRERHSFAAFFEPLVADRYVR